ncbi:hypothetical protein [Dipodfec virus UOA04_Rod_881]|nr:hypothetical protein [Dipodfec virus UOA04_Rod_881]
MKNIFICSSHKEKLGIIDAFYDRGSYSITIKRESLSSWTKGRFYYVGDVCRTDVLYLKFTACDLAEFLFTKLDFSLWHDVDHVDTSRVM